MRVSLFEKQNIPSISKHLACKSIHKEYITVGDEASNLFLIGRGSGDSMKKSKRQAATDSLRVKPFLPNIFPNGSLQNLIPGINIDANHIVISNVSDKVVSQICRAK